MLLVREDYLDFGLVGEGVEGQIGRVRAALEHCLFLVLK